MRGLEKGGDSSCRAFLEANGFKNYDLVDEAICAVLSLTGHAPVGDVALVLGLSGTTFSAVSERDFGICYLEWVFFLKYIFIFFKPGKKKKKNIK